MIAASFSVCFFSAPVFADTIVSQTVNNSNTGFRTLQSSGRNDYQELGSSFSGIAQAVSVVLDTGSVSPSDYLEVQLIQCDNAGNPIYSCTNYKKIFESYTHITASTTQTYRLGNNERDGVDQGWGYDGVMQFGKYYFLNVSVVGTGFSVRMYGSSSSTYSSGVCKYAVGGSTFSCENVADLYFILEGVNTSVDSSYTLMVSPLSGSTTVSTNVSASFQYHAVASQNPSVYIWYFNDVTLSSGSFSLSGTVTSGDHTVSQVIPLASGHTYQMNARICAAPLGLGQCWGGDTQTFSVVSSAFSIGQTTTGTSSVPLPVGPGGQLLTPVQVTDINASSSAQQSANSLLNIPQILANKFPFSWMYVVAEMLKNASSTATTIDTAQVDFSTASTTRDYDLLDSVGPITMFSDSEAKMFCSASCWSGLRYVFGLLMWVGFSYYVVGRTLNFTV